MSKLLDDFDADFEKNLRVAAGTDKPKGKEKSTGADGLREALNKPPSVAERKHRQDVEGIRLEDFYAYMPEHNYIFTPARQMWPASSVNARIAPLQISDKGKRVTVMASAWLDRNRPADQMTWAPGEPIEVKDRLISEGGW